MPGIQQTRRFLPVPRAFPAQANPVGCPVGTAPAPQPPRRDGSPRPPSPPGSVRGQRRCGNAAPAAPARPKVGADKGAASASSSRSGDLANGVHLLGSSWNNKLYHPKKQNHKRGSACSPGSQKPLVWRPPAPPNLPEKTQFNQNKQCAQPRALTLSPAHGGAARARPHAADGKLDRPPRRTPGAPPPAPGCSAVPRRAVPGSC